MQVSIKTSLSVTVRFNAIKLSGVLIGAIREYPVSFDANNGTKNVRVVKI